MDYLNHANQAYQKGGRGERCVMRIKGWISICIAAAGLLIPRAVQAQEVEPARFHHIHLNVTDPERTLEFYQRIFGAMAVKFRGVSDALFTGRSFILLTQVDSPPSGEPDTGI